MADFAGTQLVSTSLFGNSGEDVLQDAQQLVLMDYFGIGSIPGAIPTPPAQPVEVLMILPAVPGPIEPNQVVMFDVRSLQLLRRVVVTFEFEGLRFREVAFEGDPEAATPEDGFEEVYSGTSTISQITDGSYYRYRFTLMREGGVWPGSPELGVVAYNVGGEEA